MSEQGYTIPTPIQAQAIPVVLSGKDLLAAAQTGTGKTAGFTLPLLQLLHQCGNSKTIRCLILVPTRELAAQVQESVRVYGKYKPALDHHLWRRQHQPADPGLAPRRRHRRRHAGPPA